MKIRISTATIEDVDALVEMAKDLYKTNENLYNEFESILNDKDAVVFLVSDPNGLIGFEHIQIRHDYVEGCKTNNVAYLEGEYLKPDCRSHGIGKTLIEKGIKWAKDNGCKEFASDCEISNELSIKFHEAVGFNVVNKVVCFRKEI